MPEKLNAIELEKAYNPKDFEQRIYTFWEERGCFKPVKKENTSKTYTVVIPPPNVTGVLHMGHALDDTLQDVSVRYHRMKGEQTLWVPGTDHAESGRQKPKRHWARSLSRKDVGSKKRTPRRHHRTVKTARCLGGLEPRAFYP